VQFPAATGSWGTVGWYLLKDAAGGAVRGWGQLSAPKSVTAGATPSLAAGVVQISAPAA
jgi:hypothetical protein